MTICAMILNKQFPKHLVSLLIRTPVSPTFFHLSVLGSEPSRLAQPCPGQGTVGMPMTWPLPSGLMGPCPGSGRKTKPAFLWDFLSAPLCASPSPPRSVVPGGETPGSCLCQPSVSVTGMLGWPRGPSDAPFSPPHVPSWQRSECQLEAPLHCYT